MLRHPVKSNKLACKKKKKKLCALNSVLKNNNVVDEFRKSNELFPDLLVCYSTAFV